MLLAEGLDLWVFTPSLHTPLLSSFQPAWPHTVLRRKRKAFEEGLAPFSEQVFRTRVWEERLWGHTDEAAVLETQEVDLFTHPQVLSVSCSPKKRLKFSAAE